MTTQRRALPLNDKFSVPGELDNIHRIMNLFAMPPGKNVFEDYALTGQDRRIYCMRSGINLRLPVLREIDHGLIIFIKDKSGLAGSSSIVITPQPGADIEGASSLSISTNFGKYYLQWDFMEGSYFLV